MPFRIKRLHFGIALLVLAVTCTALLGYLIFLRKKPTYKRKHIQLQSNLSALALEYAVYKVNLNYGAQVEQLASRLDLPANYFKALILLECSANIPPGSRYEPHVFVQLLGVQQGRVPSYSGIQQEHLRGKSQQMLQQLATSWGPLQIMGYHAIHLGIHIDELKGDKSLYHGMVWAKRNYGHLLKKKAYWDAFHFHNTGRTYPRFGKPLTHDPYYVGNGMAYMKKLSE